jgi:3-hydroxybutyryl-CoA dehydrogenase
MKLAVVANEQFKEDLLSIPLRKGVEIDWLSRVAELNNHRQADAVIDLLFDNEKTEISLLKEFHPRPVIVNSVIKTLAEIDLSFIRINGWPTFLKRPITEAAFNIEADKAAGEKIFEAIGRKAEWVPDIPGFLSPRVIAMIINEAYFALEEKVSTKEEIDTAMKLGTNYPFGPFEWGEMIGLKNIHELLNILSIKEKRYQPATLLIKETTEK